MSDTLAVILLAVLQGVAEFLPVSSSGHLVLGQHLLGIPEAGLRLDLMLHVGTLLAIVVYYRRLIVDAVLALRTRAGWPFPLKILLSAVPAVIVYACSKASLEALFENVFAVGLCLIVTGCVVGVTGLLPRDGRAKDGDVGWRSSLAMGCAQAFALLPGISRSGMTLAAARGCRVAPDKAAAFSFLMSVPVILGGTLLQVAESLSDEAPPEALPWSLLLLGALIAGVVGYVSLALLVRVLKGRFFWLFGPYCILAGLLTLCLAR